MTRRFGPLLALLLALVSPAARARAEADAPPGIRYIGVAQVEVALRAAPSTDAEILTGFQAGQSVSILAYDLTWLSVCKEVRGQWVYGFVPRHTVTDVRDHGAQPLPYGATPALYVARLTKGAPLHAAPALTAEPLFTLPEGARVAILSVEDGWAQVIFWRQYGYLYLGDAEEMTPVYPLEEAAPGDLIGAFTSFFDRGGDETNQNRVHNIVTACAYARVTLAPGERFAFDGVVGPYTASRGYLQAPSFLDGGPALSSGGGVCQVSSTLYNVLLALPEGIRVEYRRSHGPSGAKYLPHGVDAAVGAETLNLIFVNTCAYSVTIEAEAADGVLTLAMRRGEGGT